MAMSGVEVDPECKQAFDDVRMGSKYRYVVYKIDEGNGKTGKIMIDKVKIFKAYNETCSYDFYLSLVCTMEWIS
jgi:hypothetical protein